MKPTEEEPDTTSSEAESDAPRTQNEKELSSPEGGAAGNSQDTAEPQPPRRKLNTSAVKVMGKVYKRIDTTSKPSRNYSSFTEFLGERLRGMPDNMALQCQKLFIEAMFIADLGKLNFTSRVVTDRPPLFHQRRVQTPEPGDETDKNAGTRALPDKEALRADILKHYLAAIRKN